MDNHERELREQWEASHEQRHASEADALDLAREGLNGRLREMNEFRSQISSERTNYVLRDWYEREHNTLHNELEQRHKEYDARLKVMENMSSNWQGRWWAVSSMFGLGIALGGLLTHFIQAKP